MRLTNKIVEPVKRERRRKVAEAISRGCFSVFLIGRVNNIHLQTGNRDDLLIGGQSELILVSIAAN